MLYLRGDGRVLPLLRGRGSEEAQRRSGDQMALKVEDIMDDSMNGEKTLRRHRRLEALHLVLSSSDHLV
jgi:hypothetical protein